MAQTRSWNEILAVVARDLSFTGGSHGTISGGGQVLIADVSDVQFGTIIVGVNSSSSYLSTNLLGPGGGAVSINFGGTFWVSMSSVALTTSALTFTGVSSIFKFPRHDGPNVTISAPTAARRVLVAGKSHLQVDNLLATPLLGLLDEGTMSVRGGAAAQYFLATDRSHLEVSGKLVAHSFNLTDHSTAYISGEVEADRATIYGGAVLDVNRRFKVNEDLLLNGGILTGSGKVIGNVRNKRGVVAPGDGIGRLRVDGNFRASSGEGGAALAIEIASRSKYDRLIVDGKAKIGGDVRIDLVDGFVPREGDRFKILETSEGIRGKVDGEVRLLGHKVEFTKSEGDLYLEVGEKARFDERNTFLSFTRNSNQRAVATAIRDYFRSGRNTEGFARSVGPLAPFSFDGLLVISELQFLGIYTGSHLITSEYVRMREPKSRKRSYADLQRLVLDAITPYDTFSLSQTALSLANTQLSQLENNLISQGSGMAVETPISAGVPTVSTVVEDGAKWSSFVEGAGIFALLPDVGNVSEFDYQTAAATVGGSYNVSDRFSLGVYGGYAGTTADLSGGSDLSANTGRLGIFGVWSPLDRAYLYGSLGGAVHAFEYKRKIVFPGLNRSAKSDPTGLELDTLVGGGYDFQLGNLTFGPIGSLQYTHLDMAGFTERNAGALSMRYRRQREDSLRSTLGGKAAYHIPLSSSVSIEPAVRVAWQHEYLGDQTLAASFNRGASPYFTLTSPAGARDTLLVSAGASLNLGDRFGASAFYTNSTAFDSGYVHAVQAGLRYSW